MQMLQIVLAGLCVPALLVAAWMFFERRRQKERADRAERDFDTIRAELETLEPELDRLRVEAATLGERLQSAQQQYQRDVQSIEHRYRERAEHDERKLREAHETYQKAFGDLAAKALNSSSEQFLKLAKETFAAEQEKARGDLEQRRKAVEELVKPIGETLKKTDEKLAAIEKERTSAYAGLREQVASIAQANVALKKETSNLVSALRKPQVRGRYGEIQLERVAELAGMRNYCDFSTQESVRDDSGRLRRPDMIVRLPNDRVVVVDAKTNIEAYLDALEAESPEQAETHLKRFARHVRDQADSLAKKQYWAEWEGSPEFTVMFIPGDQFVDAALEHDQTLLDMALKERIIIASPSTLIGLLRAVHVGWREKSISDSADELFALGRELHERVAVLLEHASSLGTHLNRAVDKYNKLVGSVDARLLPTLRKFEESGAKSGKVLEQLSSVDARASTVRSLPEPEPKPLAPDIVTRANRRQEAPADARTPQRDGETDAS